MELVGRLSAVRSRKSFRYRFRVSIQCSVMAMACRLSRSGVRLPEVPRTQAAMLAVLDAIMSEPDSSSCADHARLFC